ncbi:MAG: hypothetical protein WCC38_01705 [Pseudonocardiaceae bacterium]
MGPTSHLRPPRREPLNGHGAWRARSESGRRRRRQDCRPAAVLRRLCQLLVGYISDAVQFFVIDL